MTKRATGTVVWVPPKNGEKQGHYKARVTCVDGSRPWIHFDPGPRSEQAEARARERAAGISEQVREQRIVGVPQRATIAPARLGTRYGGETVVEYAERWLAARAKRGVMSIKTDRARVPLYVAPVVGHLSIAEVTRSDLQRLVVSVDAHVDRNEISWKTATNIWTLVRRMFRDSCRSKVESLRVREDNPAADLEGPDRGTRKQKCYLWPSEFLRSVSCDDVPLIWRRRNVLGVYLFARAAELEALEWSDIDLEHGVIHIHKAVDRLNGGVKETKTGLARRFSIEPNLMPLLRAMHDEAGGLGRVIHMPGDTNLARGLRHYLQRAGVARPELYAKPDDPTRKPIGFHDLRATGITWMAVRGDEPLRIQHRAGHTDFKTTQLYIREAEAVRDGFGDVFPELPESLLGDANRGNGGSNRPKNRPNGSQVRGSFAERAGFEPAVPLRVHMISNHAPSATRSPLQVRVRLLGAA